MSGNRYENVIDFTKLQSVTPEQIAQWQLFVQARPGDRILDAMSGPATGSAYIAQEQPGIHVELLDSSDVMLEAGANKLRSMGVSVGINRANFLECQEARVDTYTFDIVLLRSALHEVPKDQHADALRTAASYLNDRPESRIAVWQQVMPTDRPETLRDIIAMRDAIGGYTEQRKNRYFPTLPELAESVNAAGLSIRSSGSMDPQIFHPPVVGDQDFKGPDRAARVAALNAYIQTRIPADQRAALGYEETAINRGGVIEPSMKIEIPVHLFVLGRSSK
jgi:SAM-dependent methyltransferase